MKQDELKKSEKNQIVLGTYSMSSEGLDIKTLNTLVFISPMTNVTQSVGRILRCAHVDTIPEVYDLCDHFSTFVRQASTRRRFYQKQEYNFLQKEFVRFSECFSSNFRDEFKPYARKKKKIVNKCLF